MGGAALPPLLDTYTGAAAAYSLRKLKSDYTGKVLQVRRASDHVEVDVGFDSNGLLSLDSPVTNVTEESTGITQGSSTNAAKLGEFCGEARRSGGDTSYASVDSMTEAAHVEVVTWYDQSGSANDASQAAAASQPRVYDRASGLIVDNGKPAIQFDGGDDFLLHAVSGLISGNFTYVDTFNSSDTAAILHSSNSGVTKWVMISHASTSSALSEGFATTYQRYFKNGSSALSSGATRTDLKNAFFDGSQNIAFYHGSTNGIAAANLYLGRYHGGGYQFSGKLQESILYTSDQSALSNRTGIETNVNTFYNIY